MRQVVLRTNHRRKARRNRPIDACGFTLLELVVVVAILMVVAGMVFISALNTVQSIRLRQSATSYANLLQQARMRAVQDDTYYTVRTFSDGYGSAAYVDLNGSGTYAAGEPTMRFSPSVGPMAFASGPGLTNLESQFLPAGSGGTVNSTAPGPTFGPRGLPCTPSAPTGGTCPYITPTSYVTFLQNSQTTKWEAVTVTPAGRIRIWSYDGSSWSPLN